MGAENGEGPYPTFPLVKGLTATVWRVEDSNLCSFRDGFTVGWPDAPDLDELPQVPPGRHGYDTRSCFALLAPLLKQMGWCRRTAPTGPSNISATRSSLHGESA
jgi:hypothetical protein